MSEDEQLIAELEIQSFTTEEQQHVLDGLRLKIGEALAADYSDDQLDEYQSIIDNDTEVIQRWLTQNTPDYKSTVAYQQLAEGNDQDPDWVSPDKVYAYMAWVEKNSPGLAETVTRIKAEVKADVNSYK